MGIPVSPEALEPFKGDYKWLAALYESIKPSNVSRTLLWEKLGTKTYHLIFEHVGDVRVEFSRGRSVKLDAAGLELVRQIAENLKLPINADPDSITFEDVVGTIAFHGTGLDTLLRDLAVTQIVLVGVSTSSGVESTARSAHDYGYHVVLATDGIADPDPDLHRHAIERVFPKIGETATSAEIIEFLSRRL